MAVKTASQVVNDPSFYAPGIMALVDENNNIVAPGGTEQSGHVALSSPPAQTNAGTETVLTFSQQVNNVIIYNGTSATINYALDEAVTAGSLVLAPGYQLDKAKQVTTVHLLTASAQNVNGSSAGNIVVKGAL
jgi:hypothetical protein